MGLGKKNGILQPIRTTLQPAPDSILKLISCACKKECTSGKCSCKKAGIQCSILCKICQGIDCQNRIVMQPMQQEDAVELDDEKMMILKLQMPFMIRISF